MGANPRAPDCEESHSLLLHQPLQSAVNELSSHSAPGLEL